MINKLSLLTLVGIALVSSARPSSAQPPTKLDPPGPPAPTMKTLDQIAPIWSQVLSADQRFNLVMDGAAVLDLETGLVWQRSPFDEQVEWGTALLSCDNLSLGRRKGWRLPEIDELSSLLDDPSGGLGRLPNGHPFNNISVLSSFWSATTFGGDLTQVLGLSFDPFASGRNVFTTSKVNNIQVIQVWCVRGPRS